METWQRLLLLVVVVVVVVVGAVSGYARCFQVPRIRGLDQVPAVGVASVNIKMSV